METPKFCHPNNPPEISLSVIEDSSFTKILMRYINIVYSNFNYVNNSGDSWLATMNDKEKHLFYIFNHYHSILSSLESIDLVTKFISRYNNNNPTSDDVPFYKYVAYHYDILCYKVSTLKELFFKLINLIYELKLECCCWNSVNSRKAQINNVTLFKTLERFHSISNNLVKLRNTSAHEGTLFSSELKNIYLFQSAVKLCEMFPKDFNSLYNERYKRGTNAYTSEILELKEELLSQIYIQRDSIFNCTRCLLCSLSQGLLSLIIKLFPDMKDSFDSIYT